MASTFDDSPNAVGRDPSLVDRADPALILVPSSSAWPSEAAAELRGLKKSGGSVFTRCEHVGSTSVAGLAAKPIIDLQLSIAGTAYFAEARRALEACGYSFIPDGSGAPFWLFARPVSRPRTHHVHVCLAGSLDERRHLAVRALLRSSVTERTAYAALKEAVMKRAAGDRVAYIAGKNEYLLALERRALAWAEARGG